MTVEQFRAKYTKADCDRVTNWMLVALANDPTSETVRKGPDDPRVRKCWLDLQRIVRSLKN
jgi:hypothetical protein